MIVAVAVAGSAGIFAKGVEAMNDSQMTATTEFVVSADATKIAFSRTGKGPALILVAGLLSDRRKLAGLAETLATDFTVINFDRRGRGGSGDSPNYSVAKEIADIAALIRAAGGSASVYGHSSGAGLALQAAAAGLAIDRLVAHEPPFGPDDEASKDGSRRFARSIAELIAAGKHAEAIRTFLSGAGIADEETEAMIGDPATLAMAPTMLYDIEVMGETSAGGAIPKETIRSIRQRTLVMIGSESPPFFMDTAKAIDGLLSDGELEALAGADHGAKASKVAPSIRRFLLSM